MKSEKLVDVDKHGDNEHDWRPLNLGVYKRTELGIRVNKVESISYNAKEYPNLKRFARHSQELMLNAQINPVIKYATLTPSEYQR